MSVLATYLDIYYISGVTFNSTPANWNKYPKFTDIQYYTNAEIAFGYTQSQLVQLADISGPSTGLLTVTWQSAYGYVEIGYIYINGYYLTQLSYSSTWGSTWEIPLGAMGSGVGVEVYVQVVQGNVNYITAIDSNNVNFAYQLLPYGWTTINSYGTFSANSNAMIYISQ